MKQISKLFVILSFEITSEDFWSNLKEHFLAMAEVQKQIAISCKVAFLVKFKKVSILFSS